MIQVDQFFLVVRVLFVFESRPSAEHTPYACPAARSAYRHLFGTMVNEGSTVR
jgi:hypothetical protein